MATNLAPYVPIVGDAANLYTGWRQRKQNEKLNQQNIDESRRVMQQQRDWALEDWDKVNAYNSPAQQMERYKDAGLNPQLIYGNAQNSPSAMVRNTTQGAARYEQQGSIEAIGLQGAGVSGAFQTVANAYFANKKLENETNLTNAQILNLKAQTDKNDWSNKVTEATFNDILAKIRLQNTGEMWENSIKKQQSKNMPNQAEFKGRYNAETQRTIELLNLAKQEGKLKQGDINTMESLTGSRGGNQMIFELLKMILQGGIHKYTK